MLSIKVGAWSEISTDARQVRNAVFIEEQKIPAALEWDSEDALATHAVAYNRLGAAIGTGRLFVDATNSYRIGRMAVLGTNRSAGVGRLLLDRLVESARAQGARSVVLSAQTSAARFYARAGFVEQGQPFEEAGISHIEMRLSL
jgi:predicted GNAT family N-acyltransferase